MVKKTGIFVNERDTTQPFRVWHDGYITHFCKTLEEAERELVKEKARHNKGGK